MKGQTNRRLTNNNDNDFDSVIPNGKKIVSYFNFILDQDINQNAQMQGMYCSVNFTARRKSLIYFEAASKHWLNNLLH